MEYPLEFSLLEHGVGAVAAITPALSEWITPGCTPTDCTTTPAPWLPPPEVCSVPQPTRSRSNKAGAPAPVLATVDRTTVDAPVLSDDTPTMPANTTPLVRDSDTFIR